MTEIEHRVETTVVNPKYSDRVFTAAEIARGDHRKFVGGRWEEHGRHQLDFLVGQGLRPELKFLDVGCGSLRAGRHLIDLLEPGNYYGVDANVSLIQAGYDVELTDEQRGRLPVANLRANDRFDVDFGVQFDMAIAQSVFTHVSLNHVRLCLFRIAPFIRPGGRFFATFFEQPASRPLDAIVQKPKQRPHFSERNVFWYYQSDMRWVAGVAPWRLRYIGAWGHPNNQRMLEYTRLTEEQWAADKAAVAWADAAKAARANRAAHSGQVQRFVTRGRRWLARRVNPD